MSCVGTNLLTALQKLVGYGKRKDVDNGDDGHFVDLYWKFLNDVDSSRRSEEYERQLEDLANYHRVMKTFVRSQSGDSSSELMEALSAVQSRVKVAAWLKDCEAAAAEQPDRDGPPSGAGKKEGRRGSDASAGRRKRSTTGTSQPPPVTNNQDLHYACVEIPTAAPASTHIYAEIGEVDSADNGTATMIVKDCANHRIVAPPRDRKASVVGGQNVTGDYDRQSRRTTSSRRRSKSFSQRQRSQSCKRSNSFIMLGPQLEERPSSQQPRNGQKSSSSSHLEAAKSSFAGLESFRSGSKSTGMCQRLKSSPAKSEAARRSRLNSSSSWEVTRRPREDDSVDSMWV